MSFEQIGRRGFIKITAAAGGTLFLGGLTACSQDGGGSGGNKAGYSGDVAITGLASLIHSAPFFIAQSEGYYEEEGLTLEHIQFPGGLTLFEGSSRGLVSVRRPLFRSSSRPRRVWT